MENKTKIAIKLFEKFQDGKLLEKFYVIVKEPEKPYIIDEKIFLSEEELQEFKKVFIDFINKQKQSI